MTAALIVPLTVWLIGGMTSSSPTPQEPERCRVVRINSDGTRTDEVAMPEHSDLHAQADDNGDRAAASSRSSSSGSSSVTIQASSQSSGGGRSVASSTDGNRTITTTHDEAGCTTVIDERPVARRER